MMSGLMQITGYATGGALVALLSPEATLLVASALYAAAALVTRLGLTRRAPRAEGRPSVSATWRTNALPWSYGPRRHLYLALWIPNGLVVGCESLYVTPALVGASLRDAGEGGLVVAGRRPKRGVSPTDSAPRPPQE